MDLQSKMLGSYTSLRVLSHRLTVLHSKKPGKKKLKIPTDSAQPTTNDQIITRSMVSTPQETTATTRSKVIPHNERIHTEGHIQLGTRESALLEFLDCDPTLRSNFSLLRES